MKFSITMFVLAIIFATFGFGGIESVGKYTIFFRIAYFIALFLFIVTVLFPGSVGKNRRMW